MKKTNHKGMNWFIIVVEAVMHLLWCANDGRHLPDLHQQLLSESCFWTGKTESNSLGMQVNRGGKHLILQAIVYQSLKGTKMKLVMSFLSVLGFVH